MNKEHHQYFDWLDYLVFGLLLLGSAMIGLYFAFFAKTRQNTMSEYLLGGKKMGILPVSISLIASYISGTTLIAIPSEMYVYGTQFWALVIAQVISALFMAFLIMPVFYNLEITSTYEYLNRRYNSPTVRTVGSILFICKMLLSIPIVIYVPALAFSQVSGFSIQVMIPSICVICIFYTTLGGIKAVVWTITLYTVLMVVGALSVAGLGTYDVGGFSKVWEISKKGDRIEFFNLSFDPTIRHTLWNVVVGKSIHQVASCTINQSMVQRCLAMPTLRNAKITIGLYAVGIAVLFSVCSFTGLVMYAAFHDCDPLKTGAIGKADQLLPYFVMKETSHIPMLPGIFVCGVFGAALSTMSTGLNSMCGIVLEDFIKPLTKGSISEGRASVYMKIVTAILGTVCVFLAFAVDKLGGIIQTSGSLSGITGGTLLGMFLLGMLFPWANATGAFAGGVSAAILVGWMCIGSQLAIGNKQLVFPTKPVSVDGCDNTTFSVLSSLSEINYTSPLMENKIEVSYFYRISYTYYTVIGMITAIVVGLIVSYFTGFNDPSQMDRNLFSPIIQGYIDKKHNARLMDKQEAEIKSQAIEKQAAPLLIKSSDPSSLDEAFQLNGTNWSAAVPEEKT